MFPFTIRGNDTTGQRFKTDVYFAQSDADPDIPILKEAKTEYAKLQ